MSLNVAAPKSGGRGGARPGAGRKPKDGQASDVRDPLEFLLNVMQGTIKPSANQLKAAVAAVQYMHAKKGDGGKKQGELEAAIFAAAGRFGARPAPTQLQLVSNE